MSQITENICKNKQFYKCVVENGKCVNCKKSYVKEGDMFNGKCWKCGKISLAKVNHVYYSGEIRVYCESCTTNMKLNEDLYSIYVSEDIFYDGRKEFSNDEITERLNDLVEKISSLPKEQLKTFLRDVHGTIER